LIFCRRLLISHPALAIIQITSRGLPRKYNIINYIQKRTLLCPSIYTGAKQGTLSYIYYYQWFAKHSPARDLYAIREKCHRKQS